MTKSLALDPVTWDLMIDAAGNIATVSGDERLAQDVATAVRTFSGEVIYDSTLGIRWLQDILGQAPNIALVKADCEAAALTVPGVATAQAFLTSVSPRGLGGQVQVTATDGTTVLVTL